MRRRRAYDDYDDYCYLGGGRFTPADLGPSLLAWWDAERTDLITEAAGAVSSWRDVVGGYDAVQATGAAQPIWSTTSFNGRPGITADGVDDQLTFVSAALLAQLAGASNCEIWVACDQSAAPADTTVRIAFSIGAAGNVQLQMRRSVETATNRFVFSVGDGVGQQLAENTGVDFSGRHILRGIVTPTSAQADIDGTAGAPIAVVPNTGMIRGRLFANANGLPVQFYSGSINAALITRILAPGPAAQLFAWLNARNT